MNTGSYSSNTTSTSLSTPTTSLSSSSGSHYELHDPPVDGITELTFHASEGHLLLCSSWDRTVRLYDTRENQLLTQVNVHTPVLNVQWDPFTFQCYLVGLSGQVGCVDLNSLQFQQLGQHEAGLRAMVYSASEHLIYTGGWDQTLRTWDPRTSKCVNVLPLPSSLKGRILDLDITPSTVSSSSSNTTTTTTSSSSMTPSPTTSTTTTSMSSNPSYLVVATHDQRILIYDRKKMESEPMEVRDNGLRYMTRRVKCLPNGKGYACTSVEGRIAIDYFDAEEDTHAFKKFTFKCHRVNREETELIYPVNCIDFHPIYPTSFASGGGDGTVNIWDGFNKKRLRCFPTYSTSISSLSFAPEGRKVAIAVSYTYEEGGKE